MSDKITNLGKLQKLSTCKVKILYLQLEIKLWFWKFFTDSFGYGSAELLMIAFISVGGHLQSSTASGLLSSHVAPALEVTLYNLGLERKLWLEKSCGGVCFARASRFVFLIL